MSLHLGFLYSVIHFQARPTTNDFSETQLMMSDGILLFPRCSDFTNVHDCVDEHMG